MRVSASGHEQDIVRTDFGEEPGQPQPKRAFGGLEGEAWAGVGHKLLANVGANVAGMMLARRATPAIDAPSDVGPLYELLIVLPVALQEHQIQEPKVGTLVLLAACKEPADGSDVPDATKGDPAAGKLEGIVGGAERLAGSEKAALGCGGVELCAKDACMEAGVVCDGEDRVETTACAQENGEGGGRAEKGSGTGVECNLLDNLCRERVERSVVHGWCAIQRARAYIVDGDISISDAVAYMGGDLDTVLEPFTRYDPNGDTLSFQASLLSRSLPDPPRHHPTSDTSAIRPLSSDVWRSECCSVVSTCMRLVNAHSLLRTIPNTASTTSSSTPPPGASLSTLGTNPLYSAAAPSSRRISPSDG